MLRARNRSLDMKPRFAEKSKKSFKNKLQIVASRVESLGVARDMEGSLQYGSQDMDKGPVQDGGGWQGGRYRAGGQDNDIHRMDEGPPVSGARLQIPQLLHTLGIKYCPDMENIVLPICMASVGQVLLKQRGRQNRNFSRTT